ncbi:MAG: hypothetical protein QOG62_1644 [Thermoleophilaceae bacterium]|jgi:integrase|nr:hypothetical protein [Thermoleophilaceae bacterium]
MAAIEDTLANVSPETQRSYAALWRAHVHPHLADDGLRELRPEAVERFRLELVGNGVAPDAIDATLSLLRSVFSDGSSPIIGTPAEDTDGGEDAGTRALEPREIERLRAGLGARDGVIVSLLAYAGLRPGELLALRWKDIRGGHLRVDGRKQAVRGHTSVHSVRDVQLLRPLAADLAGWREAAPGTDPESLVIPGPDGGQWSDSAWAQWRREHFNPAVKAAGLPAGTRPYDLRHTFAWLLLREGGSVTDVSRETGYSPLTALRIYRGLADRAQAAGHRLAPEAIAVARAA